MESFFLSRRCRIFVPVGYILCGVLMHKFCTTVGALVIFQKKTKKTITFASIQTCMSQLVMRHVGTNGTKLTSVIHVNGISELHWSYFQLVPHTNLLHGFWRLGIECKSHKIHFDVVFVNFWSVTATGITAHVLHPSGQFGHCANKMVTDGWAIILMPIAFYSSPKSCQQLESIQAASDACLQL